MSEYGLAIEKHPVTVPIPVGIAIVFKGRPVGFITLEEFDRVAGDLQRMREAREGMK